MPLEGEVPGHVDMFPGLADVAVDEVPGPRKPVVPGEAGFGRMAVEAFCAKDRADVFDVFFVYGVERFLGGAGLQDLKPLFIDRVGPLFQLVGERRPGRQEKGRDGEKKDRDDVIDLRISNRI